MARQLFVLMTTICAMTLLTACLSPEEIRAHDEAACAGYGFQPRTADFAACIQREVLARRYAWHGPYWGSMRFWR